MKTLTFLLFIFTSGWLEAQVYVDPAVSGAQATHAAVINNQLNKTNERLTLIEKGQLAVTGKLSVVNTLQEKLYAGLTEVSAILTNLANVREIARIASGISGDVRDIMELAKENPEFIVFAEQNATMFQQRATALALEVQQFALKGGKENLMDAGERAKILNTILNELLILRSYSYGMYRSMHFASMRGLFNSLNPFQGYIEMDLAIMDDILRKRETLNR
ncbi:hypothetical protein Q4534_06440 [Cyclobacterium sp. 1_MG-2023]|uniref:hypothetical protein n=1 Tax=Cyclobacterium sp. 1_MG-2023 TaxID=3062681 RepID=UPI0026E1C384|nr:hypothetical protein [Cyclobacterium sp. 1_MG-2023]MDO6437034.1 hypothetical protein [Cyclobacterium sp. 1_MG-2023]